MAKAVTVLTDVRIKNAKPLQRARKLFDGRGLFLVVTPNGAKWWRLKYRFLGKEKLLSLGVYPDVGLKQARERCDASRKLLAEGVDPSAHRQAAKVARIGAARCDSDSFESVAREWFGKFSAGWADSHAETVLSRLERDVFPWLGGRPVREITAVQLLELLRRIEARGALETAHRIKQIIGQVFRFAIATGRATRDPSADLRGALPPRRQVHHAALTKPTDVAGLMRAISGYQGSFVVRCALRLASLLFVRPGELRRMEWSEIDFDRATWTLPAEKMKMRSSHLVPLSPQALAVLRELRPLTGNGRYVFPSARTSTRCLSENAVLAALRRMGFSGEEQTGHGFRTMASTILHENGWPSDIIELQLAHVSHRNSVRAAYDRSERLGERKEMMKWWSDYVDTLVAADSLQSQAPGPAYRHQARRNEKEDPVYHWDELVRR